MNEELPYASDITKANDIELLGAALLPSHVSLSMLSLDSLENK